VKTLDTLALGRNHVTDAGLAHLAHLVQLRALLLEHNQIQGAGLAHLKNLGPLDRLELQGNAITDAGLQNWPPSLRVNGGELNLAGNRIVGHGLAALGPPAQVRRLVLSDNPLSEACVEPLRRMKGLKELSLFWTHPEMSPGLAEKLKKELPGVSVQ
jgi:hypothetical protein